MPGTTWTMGAMFAQTSGLPLNISIDSNGMDTQDSFFRELLQWEIFFKRRIFTDSFVGIGCDIWRKEIIFYGAWAI